MMSLESPAARASQIGRQILVYGKPLTPPEIVRRIEEVSVADIRQIAESIFTGSRPTLAMIGPKGISYDPERLNRRLSG
jgi:predicted Zn-dependent peptidase